MNKFPPIKGMHDNFSPKTDQLRSLEAILINSAEKLGYNEVRTPILENLNLFKKTIGSDSDIVEKEMFTFNTSKDDVIALRPEGTCATARFVANNDLNDQINKFWYLGPFFRHERPQKGRYRQFHQFGVELFGSKSMFYEAELFLLINKIWKNLDLQVPTFEVNNIGTYREREEYSIKLKDFFKKHLESFDENTQKKMMSNPLRVLDSKDPKIKNIIDDIPIIENYLSSKTNDQFKIFLETLDTLGVKYKINSHLVRGLDYYNDIVFEIKSRDDHTQNTICAGGRYDGLMSIISNKEVPAIGFAIGIERLINEINTSIFNKNKKSIYLISLDPEYESFSLEILKILYDFDGIFVINNSLGGSSNLKSQLKKAEKLDTNFCIIIGRDEFESRSVSFKNMNTRKQEKVTIDALSNKLKDVFNEKS